MKRRDGWKCAALAAHQKEGTLELCAHLGNVVKCFCALCVYVYVLLKPLYLISCKSVQQSVMSYIKYTRMQRNSAAMICHQLAHIIAFHSWVSSRHVFMCNISQWYLRITNNRKGVSCYDRWEWFIKWPLIWLPGVKQQWLLQYVNWGVHGVRQISGSHK